MKNKKEEPKQDNCCTPVGQIKRYIDCKGCNRKPKQETLEEAAEKEYPTIHEQYQYDALVNGAKWQQEQDKNKYSEEDLKEAFRVGFNVGYNDAESPSYLKFEEWIEQFKNK